MILLIGILCFVIGLCVGAVLFKQFKSDAVKVEKLEEQLSTLQAEYDHYKNNVNSHFSGTAQLVDNFTESYREVYRHLAAGAHSLCSESISSQLFLSTENNDLIPGNYSNNTATTSSSTPPLTITVMTQSELLKPPILAILKSQYYLHGIMPINLTLTKKEILPKIMV